MGIYHLFILLIFAGYCTAGPLVALIADVVAVFSETAAGTFATSFVGELVGIGASSGWYDGYVLVNGALYYGTGAAGYGALAGGTAGGAAGK